MKYVPSGLRADKPHSELQNQLSCHTLDKAEKPERQPKAGCGTGYLERGPAGNRHLFSSRKTVNLFHIHQRAVKATELTL